MKYYTEKVNYFIDGKGFSFSANGTSAFQFGKDEILSNDINDITYNLPWYNEGYVIESIFNSSEFATLKAGISNAILKTIQEETQTSNFIDFRLEDYHLYVRDDKVHQRIVEKTRDLFEEDFDFPIFKYISKFEDILRMKLTNVFKPKNHKVHVIIRINRPLSNDFNPPHKDMYEGLDAFGFVPKFVNFWIPIAGVTQKNSLPIVPQSHKINEKSILRTRVGGIIENNQYRVRMIKSWDGNNQLIRSKIKDGEVLIFSSHLIHGLAFNEEVATTRIALEYRLFKES